MAVQTLNALLTHPDLLRNFCMLAHVDHGKTTLSDILIAANGIISNSLAGKLRFMDTREDEQERQITMKVSSILLTGTYKEEQYFLNLLDSPGHIDFSAEVSTAVRLADGGIVLVDVVDGVGIQTQVVLQQAYRERIRMVLVLNKMDLLFTTLQLSPQEAYEELNSVLANVNVIMSSLVNSDQIERAAVVDPEAEEGEAQDTDDWFMPHKGNVVFASALHGWGFGVEDFAQVWAEKLQCNPKALARALWGEHYWDAPKGKPPRIVKHPPKPGQSPMFVKFCLEPIAQVYDAVYKNPEEAKLQQMAEKLKLTRIRPNELRSKDPEVAAKALLTAWLPLAPALTGMVIRTIEPPCRALRSRLPFLFPELYSRKAEASEFNARLRAALETGDTGGDLVVVYVGKMYECESLGISVDRAKVGGDQLLAFARVLCGTLRKGQPLYVLGPSHTPNADGPSPVTVGQLYLPQGRDMLAMDAVPAGCICSIRGLQAPILKTATLASDPRVPPCRGMAQPSAPIVHFVVSPQNQFEMHRLHAGIQLLHKADSQVEFVMRDVEVIVKAAGQVHAQLCLKDLEEVFARIKLNISDPIVALKETITLDESVRSYKQMEQQRVTLFTPNKQFRVTLHALPLPTNLRAYLEEHQKVLEELCTENAQRSGKTARFEAVAALRGLEAEFQRVEGPMRKRWHGEYNRLWSLGPNQCGPCMLLNHATRFLAPSLWTPYVPRILRQHVLPASPPPPPNRAPDSPTVIQSDAVPGNSASSSSTLPPPADDGHSARGSASVTQRSARSDDHLETRSVETEQSLLWKAQVFRETLEYIVQGFQQATLAGPMCGEPMVGVAFLVDELEFYQTVEHATAAYCQFALQRAKEKLHLPPGQRGELTEEQEALMEAERRQAAEQVASSFGRHGSHGAQVISCVRQACLEAFALQPRRLVEPIYRVQVVIRGDHSGKVYSALQRKRAEVVDEVLREGTSIHLLEAVMPVAESFNFTEELWARTGGAAHAQLQFGHWAMLDEDPYWVPRTDDDKEEFGAEAKILPSNVASRLLQRVRRQKGLAVEEAAVQEGEKMKKYSTTAT